MSRAPRPRRRRKPRSPLPIDRGGSFGGDISGSLGDATPLSHFGRTLDARHWDPAGAAVQT